MRTVVHRCQRFSYCGHDKVELVQFYKLPIGRLGRFIRPEDMPPFEGEVGFVEVLGPTTRLKVLRQVEEGTPTREATEEERRAIYASRKRQ